MAKKADMTAEELQAWYKKYRASQKRWGERYRMKQKLLREKLAEADIEVTTEEVDAAIAAKK